MLFQRFNFPTRVLPLSQLVPLSLSFLTSSPSFSALTTSSTRNFPSTVNLAGAEEHLFCLFCFGP